MTFGNWSQLSDFLAMGGYGLYVWGSFGMAAAVMVAECAALRGRRRAFEAAVADLAPTGSAPRSASATDFTAVAHEA